MLSFIIHYKIVKEKEKEKYNRYGSEFSYNTLRKASILVGGVMRL